MIFKLDTITDSQIQLLSDERDERLRRLYEENQDGPEISMCISIVKSQNGEDD
jgi:hypothetical protein